MVHFGGYVALSVLHEILAMLLLRMPSYIPAGFHGLLLTLRVVESLNEDFWMYWPIVVIWSLVEYYQRYHERDLRASHLRSWRGRNCRRFVISFTRIFFSMLSTPSRRSSMRMLKQRMICLPI